MKAKYILSISFLFMYASSLLQGQNNKLWREKFDFSLVTSFQICYELKNDKVQTTKFVLKPTWEYKINRSIKLVGVGRIYTEFMDYLEFGQPSQEYVSGFSSRHLIGNLGEMELREFYIKWYLFQQLNLVVGKQQIVWGETDGLKLLDVINPQYFREFILENFEDSRIPLWSLKVEFPIKKLRIQIVWIPDQSYHVLPGFNDPFFPRSVVPRPPEGVLFIQNKVNKPSRFFADSDIGLKLSTFLKGWDITVAYLYHFDDFAVLYTDFDFQQGQAPELSLNPEYKRSHLLGYTINKAIKSLTIRAETVYSFDRYFSSISDNAIRGVLQSDQFLSAVGIDFIKGEYVVSVQFFIDYLMNNIAAFNRERLEKNISMLTSKEFMNDVLKVEISWINNINNGDGLIRPKINYWLSSNIKILLGSDIFYGKSEGLFGQFNDRSRVLIGFSWGI